MIDNYPSAPAKTDKLVQLKTDYEIVYVVLLAELSWRRMQLRNADAADEENYAFLQKQRDDAQSAMDALVRIKDVAKLALLEQQVSVAEQWKQEELIQDVEFKPVRLSY